MEVMAPERETLLENLRSAFESESNARARYLAFAEKADGEGWHGVASLLRATARAEQVHTLNHGRLLRLLGGHTEFDPEDVDVKTTHENLRGALAEELLEAETTYPALLLQARQARDVAAVRTFTWAMEAERTHVRLLNEALTLVEFEDDDAWIAMSRLHYVCPVCGYTSEQVEGAACPVCNCVWTRFDEIR